MTKKIFLLLSLYLLLAPAAFAKQTVVSFNERPSSQLSMTTSCREVVDFSLEGIDFSAYYCLWKQMSGAGFLQISSYENADAYLEFTLRDNCESVVLYPAKTIVQSARFQLFADGTAISDDMELSDPSADYSVVIPQEYRAPGTRYRLCSSNQKNLQISSLVITSSTTLQPANLSFEESEVIGWIGEPVRMPALRKDTDATPYYSSSAPEVASVTIDGQITLHACGSTTVSAYCEPTEIFAGGSASFILTVERLFTNIEDLYAAKPYESGKIGFLMTVGFAGQQYVYATDGTQFVRIRGLSSGLNSGDVLIPGWRASHFPLYEVEVVEPADFPEVASSATEFKPEEVNKIFPSMVNKVVKLKNVTFAAPTPSGLSDEPFTGTVGTYPDLATYNFVPSISAVPSVDSGIYNVKVVVGFNSGEIELYPVAYEKVDRIGEVMAEDSNVEFFNLQGMRVARPERGIFIRIIGGRPVKIKL